MLIVHFLRKKAYSLKTTYLRDVDYLRILFGLSLNLHTIKLSCPKSTWLSLDPVADTEPTVGKLEMEEMIDILNILFGESLSH